MATTKTRDVPGYKFKVVGEYFARLPNGDKVKKHYGPEEFIFPELVSYRSGTKTEKIKDPKDPEGKRLIKITKPVISRVNSSRIVDHLIQRYYLEPRLKAKFTDYIRFRTCEVSFKQRINIPASQFQELEKKPVDEMDEAELLQFMAINDMTLDLKNYGDLTGKKEAVKRAWSKVQATQKARKAKAQEDLTDSEDTLVDDSGLSEDEDDDGDLASKFE